MKASATGVTRLFFRQYIILMSLKRQWARYFKMDFIEFFFESSKKRTDFRDDASGLFIAFRLS